MTTPSDAAKTLQAQRRNYATREEIEVPLEDPTTIRLETMTQRQLLARMREPDAYGAMSAAIRETLERYFHLLSLEGMHMVNLFTRNECAVICAVTNGSLEQSYSIPAIGESILDGVDANPDGSFAGALGLVTDGDFSIDLKAFRHKLRSLTLLQCFVLADAIERWWARCARGESPDYGELLR